jgi:hypothetical protein
MLSAAQGPVVKKENQDPAAADDGEEKNATASTPQLLPSQPPLPPLQQTRAVNMVAVVLSHMRTYADLISHHHAYAAWCKVTDKQADGNTVSKRVLDKECRVSLRQSLTYSEPAPLAKFTARYTKRFIVFTHDFAL